MKNDEYFPDWLFDDDSYSYESHESPFLLLDRLGLSSDDIEEVFDYEIEIDSLEELRNNPNPYLVNFYEPYGDQTVTFLVGEYSI